MHFSGIFRRIQTAILENVADVLRFRFHEKKVLSRTLLFFDLILSQKRFRGLSNYVNILVDKAVLSFLT